MSFLLIINTTNKNEIIVITIPAHDDKVNEIKEKLIIPSTTYLNKDQNHHFASPTIQSIFSLGYQCVLKPTHPKIPLEKWLYSSISTIASTIDLFIKRKSLVPSTTSTSEILLIIL